MASFALPIAGAVGDLLGGLFGSNAAQNAAGVEAGVFNSNSNQLIGVGEQQLRGELRGLNPYLAGGAQGFNTLAGLLRPGGSLLQGYNAPLPQFQAPTLEQARNTPGYQFQLQQGENAIQNSAAARGDLLSGNTLAALNQYGQGLADTSYSQLYNQALQNYGAQMQRYQAGGQTFYQNQANQYQRLMGLGGAGLNAAQLADQARQGYVGTYGQAMNMSNAAGAAQAAGIMGSSNSWQNALGGMFGNGMNLMSMLGGGGGGGSPYFGQMSPTQISGAYGGPTQVPTIQSQVPNYIPYNGSGY